MPINRFDKSNIIGRQGFSVDEIKKSKFGDYFFQLEQNLEKSASGLFLMEQAIGILKLNCHDDFREYINKILVEIPDFGFQIRRMIIFNRDELSFNHICVGSGKNHDDLEYLDDQLIKLLEKNEKIFINDTSKIRSIKFRSEKSFPKTVLGLTIGNIERPVGILWFATFGSKTLTKEEADSLFLIVNATGAAITKTIELLGYKQRNQMLESIFNSGPCLIFILDEKKILQANQQAIELFSTIDPVEMEKFPELLFSAKNLNEKSLMLGDGNFRIIFQDNISQLSETQSIVFLMDEGETSQQRKYLRTVMQTISKVFTDPLNNIAGYLKMWPLIGQVNQPQEEYLIKLNTETIMCKEIISDLLEINRLANQNPLILANYSITEVINGFHKSATHRLRQKRVNFIYEICEQDFLINIDLSLFYQALYLLLDFILEKLSPGKNLTITSSSLIDEWQIVFKDDGNGIAGLEMEKLDQPTYYMPEDSRIRIAVEILQFHNGKLIMNSEPGKGSEFILSCPWN